MANRQRPSVDYHSLAQLVSLQATTASFSAGSRAATQKISENTGSALELPLTEKKNSGPAEVLTLPKRG